jgi:hypothetical protein
MEKSEELIKPTIIVEYEVDEWDDFGDHSICSF